MKAAILVPSVALAVTIAACGPARGGALSPTGYASTKYAYEVTYDDPSARTFLPAPWRLDNFTTDNRGNLIEKDKGTYIAIRKLDENADGEVSASERQEEHLYDLRFVNGRDNGVIWSKAHPMRFVDRDRELSVIVDNYIDSLSGTGLYTEGSVFSTEQGKERDYTTFVKEKRNIVVDRHPAVMAVVEIAEAEKLKADPAYRKQKVKVIFTRFGYLDRVDNRRSETNGWPVVDNGPGRRFLARRGILVLGYANTGDDFDRDVAAFDSFVLQVRFPQSNPPATPPPTDPPPVATAAPATSPAPPAVSSAPSAPPAASR